MFAGSSSCLCSPAVLLGRCGATSSSSSLPSDLLLLAPLPNSSSFAFPHLLFLPILLLSPFFSFLQTGSALLGPLFFISILESLPNLSDSNSNKVVLMLECHNFCFFVAWISQQEFYFYFSWMIFYYVKVYFTRQLSILELTVRIVWSLWEAARNFCFSSGLQSIVGSILNNTL